MPSIRIEASSDTLPRPTQSTHVSDYYCKPEFTVEFTGWKNLRKEIQKQIAIHYEDGERRWIWGLYGSDDKRTFKYQLYDQWKINCTERSIQEDRNRFEAKLRASPASLIIKAKWSFKEQGLEARSAQKNDSIARQRLDAAMGTQSSPSQDEIPFHYEVYRLQQTLQWLIDELLEGPSFSAERKARADAGLDIQEPSGAINFLPPYAEAMIKEDLEQGGVRLYSSYVIIESSKAAKLKEAIKTARATRTRADSHGRGTLKIKRRWESSVDIELCTSLSLVNVRNGFIHVHMPSAMKSISSVHPRTI